MYQDEGIKKTKSVDIGSSSVQAEMSLEEIIRSLFRVGYEVINRKASPGG
ncbi:MAG: hypothetical protein MUO26_13215 [Methanotrichaceae archaeon]|nr:hypothetical protein [Methanotrichaceae archaeon]